MKDLRKRLDSSHELPPAETTAERRRIGRVMHDDRGVAVLEWLDAPDGYERAPLSLEGPTQRAALDEPKLTLSEDATASFNPYEHVPVEQSSGNTVKRDLRKLSEWIKLTRDLEERKRRGED